MSEVVDTVLENLDGQTFVPQEGVDAPYGQGRDRDPVLDQILNEDDGDEEEEEDYDYEYEYDSDDSLDDELKLINAQLQWEESLEQLKTLAGWVILPLIGKMLGRRFAGYVWRRVMDTFY